MRHASSTRDSASLFKIALSSDPLLTPSQGRPGAVLPPQSSPTAWKRRALLEGPLVCDSGVVRL